ncbi:hypothetical protein PR048_028659 [Dryococelus australis]|uniref:Uncharacterized protein n=1 Tax=Dryococelus australis TaxID=614101 RepID=A0ABQ9GDQ8_9NEOP|nr:hypothetical protein PR048_028659 [Dryococelus australis]
MGVKRGEYGAAPECKGEGNWTSPRKLVDQRHKSGIEPCSPRWKANSLMATTPPRAFQKQSSDIHKTPYDRVKRCRERKIYIKASERVNMFPRTWHSLFPGQQCGSKFQQIPECLTGIQNVPERGHENHTARILSEIGDENASGNMSFVEIFRAQCGNTLLRTADILLPLFCPSYSVRGFKSRPPADIWAVSSLVFRGVQFPLSPATPLPRYPALKSAQISAGHCMLSAERKRGLTPCCVATLCTKNVIVQHIATDLSVSIFAQDSRRVVLMRAFWDNLCRDTQFSQRRFPVLKRSDAAKPIRPKARSNAFALPMSDRVRLHERNSHIISLVYTYGQFTGPWWRRDQSARLPPRRSALDLRLRRSGYFRTWESCRTMPLISEFSRGSPVYPRPFNSGAAPYSHQSPSSALKISLLKATQISSLTFDSVMLFVREAEEYPGRRTLAGLHHCTDSNSANHKTHCAFCCTVAISLEGSAQIPDGARAPATISRGIRTQPQFAGVFTLKFSQPPSTLKLCGENILETEAGLRPIQFKGCADVTRRPPPSRLSRR